MNAQDADRVIRALGQQAAQTNRRRSQELDEAVRRAAAGELSRGQRTRATEVAHQLLGSAGTFGVPQATALAATLERFFAEGDFGRERVAAARRAVLALRGELDAG